MVCKIVNVSYCVSRQVRVDQVAGATGLYPGVAPQPAGEMPHWAVHEFNSYSSVFNWKVL